MNTLQCHGHWVNVLALNTDYAMRTGAFDPCKQNQRDQEHGYGDNKTIPAGKAHTYQLFEETQFELLEHKYVYIDGAGCLLRMSAGFPKLSPYTNSRLCKPENALKCTSYIHFAFY